jgi:hypothetical protein
LVEASLALFHFWFVNTSFIDDPAEAASDVAATIVTYSDLEKPDWLDTTVLKLDKAGSENYFTEIPADTFIDAAETASRK